MPRPQVDSCPRAWSRALAFALVGIAAAGCADSARFESNSYSSDRPAPPQNVASMPAPSAGSRIVAQPLSPPAAVAAAPTNYGGASPASYRFSGRYSETTGSSASVPSASSHWTWDGGSAVTVGYGETVDSIARRHGVPASAILQTNGIRDAAQIRPGQRLVIPRHVTNGTQTASRASSPVVGGKVHVVKSSETLMSISRRTGVSLTALARANHLQTSSRLSVGDRLTIPYGGNDVASAYPASAPQAAQERPAPLQKVASLAAVHTANVAKEDQPQKPDAAVKTAEPNGAMPSFRWPVRGRVIAGFGSKPNGTQNDGVNLAVPEGTPIKAADDGVVAYAGNELKGYGNLVLIRHANGFVSAYAHASEIMVKRGDTIKRGQVIAHAGQTGNVTSPQLHFEIRKGSTPVDPTQYLGGV
jgi:murein DD-endopeptidase MepM/ murein hydrolase activator NlpD